MHEESVRSLEKIRIDARDKRIAFVSGNFNVLHPGHLRLLKFAKECADFLVVGVLDGTSPGAIVHEQLRLDSVSAVGLVDHSFILRDTPEEFISELKPEVVVKGKEHESRNNPEKAVLEATGGKLLFTSGDMRFSSLDLLKSEFREINLSTIRKPLDFPTRHGFSLPSLEDDLKRMANVRVCVIGDTIVDEYITCDALGMSQEDPTIVVSPVSVDRFVGGAGIVAEHARGLGRSVEFFSVIGKDDTARYVREVMEKSGVELHAYEDETRHTTLKQRYRADRKTLLRVSHLQQHAIASEVQERMIGDLERVLPETDLLLFSDFNYGCLPQPLVSRIIDLCGRHGIMTAADSQSSSQIGDVSRFSLTALLTPTERELRLAVHDFESGLVVCADKLRKKSAARNIIITLGSEGVLLHAETNKKDLWLTDRLPALNSAPKDVAGAGDSLLTCTAIALASGASIWRAAYLGSLAAACQVGRLGNIPLSTNELLAEIKDSYGPS